MLDAIIAALNVIWSWFRTFSFALVNRNGELYSLLIPLLIGVGITILFVAIKIIKSITWGN